MSPLQALQETLPSREGFIGSLGNPRQFVVFRFQRVVLELEDGRHPDLLAVVAALALFC
jgi:hypothetical protein